MKGSGGSSCLLRELGGEAARPEQGTCELPPARGWAKRPGWMTAVCHALTTSFPRNASSFRGSHVSVSCGPSVNGPKGEHSDFALYLQMDKVSSSYCRDGTAPAVWQGSNAGVGRVRGRGGRAGAASPGLERVV